MTVAEMLEMFRWRVHEPDEANVSNARIVTVLQEAQEHVCSIIRGLDQKFFVTTQLLDTVKDATTIAFPSDMYASGILRLEIMNAGPGVGPTVVPIVGLHDKDQLITAGAIQTQNVEAVWISGNSFHWINGFAASTVGAYRLWYEKRLKTLSLLTDDATYTTTSELPVEYHDIPVLWGALQYYAKVDDDAGALYALYNERISQLTRDLQTRQRQGSRRVHLSADQVGQFDDYYFYSLTGRA